MNFSGLPPWLNWTAGAAILAGIAAGWSHVKAFFDRLTLILFDRATLSDQSGFAALSYGWKLGYRSPLTTKLFGGAQLYVNVHHRYEVVGYETLGSQPRLIWYKGRPVSVSISSSGGDSKSSGDGLGQGGGLKVTLVAVRGMVNLRQFMVEAVEHYNNVLHPDGTSSRLRFCVHRCTGMDRSREKDEELRAAKGGSDIESLFATGVVRPVTCRIEDIGMKSPNQKQVFAGYAMNDHVKIAVKEARRWLASAEWFRNRNVPWRRGWLLYGPPGTGKTSLARLVGMDLDLPIYVFDLTAHTNESFYKSWQDMMNNTPCIALIEDIDTAFHGRNNVSKGWRDAANKGRKLNEKLESELKEGRIVEGSREEAYQDYFGTTAPTWNALTFDCLLNCISGVTPAEGVFTIVTTNHVELLDPALGRPVEGTDGTSRPGRLDRAIYLGNLDRAGRKQLASFILSDFPDLIDPLVDSSEDTTPAQFQDKCVRLAEKTFWEREDTAKAEQPATPNLKRPTLPDLSSDDNSFPIAELDAADLR